MSDAYVREQQNNALLDALAQKTRALKSVTIDIYDNAKDHNTIENTSEVFSSLSTNIRGSAGRLTRMAKQGDRIAITKVAGIVVVIGYLGLGAESPMSHKSFFGNELNFTAYVHGLALSVSSGVNGVFGSHVYK
ncbi:hypothetical protein PAAG_01314 [Paracoccidioides lutzii Pb01]|uniref:Uncharacterized protein n=1 Tax=Paracoccidioides lutzii (strain ATCC MYA-826 / Pb01) TaxID=502779 RepID=C1GS19_PARBA|nr:hypothetical protein PAAG_01314 [Paracoccidioides lutzii Pb01]EEH38393.2 hypothetical protein PAAG_01314 [Paracoccidioides lutzii Pb01]